MFKYIRDLRNKKAFTLIELIVVIAVVGILVLLAMPKFFGHVEDAQLARIKHDVKVMQNEMDLALSEKKSNFKEWDNNKKNLSVLILKKQLYENKGLAKKLDKSHITHPNYNWVADNGLNGNVSLLGVGGELLTEENIVYSYKIIPDEYKKKIRTKLKGTFYTNAQGKVYYEPERPIVNKEETLPNCLSPEALEYEFDHETGTIVKYLGSKQYLTIPGSFLVNGKCYPVKIIGVGAFSNRFPLPPLKEVEIPKGVEIIEEDAFKDNEIEKVIIPPNVDEIGDNAFGNNPLTDVTVQGPQGSVNIGNGSFGGLGSGGSGGSGGGLIFSPPTNKDLGVNVNIKRDKDGNPILGPNGKPSGSISSGSFGGDSGENSDGILVIPPVIIVNGEEIEIVEIEEGGFQGEGLIHVVLPDGLERIEDYAFAGNQMIGISFPESLKHVGNYAFAYNEVTSDSGDEYLWTIEYIDFKKEEKVNQVDHKTGDIKEDGSKLDNIKDTNTLDHIWLNSNSGFIIPDDYGDDGYLEKPGETIDPDIGKYVATDEDFSGATNGDFKYIGNKEIVEIPHVIKGVEVTSYRQMFDDSQGARTSNVKKVISTNTNVTNMTGMFWNSRATRLDLSSFDTSNVTSMNSMFRDSQATKLDLSSFNTSNVAGMFGMFWNSRASSLDLSSFDISNVTWMRSMFLDSKATSIVVKDEDTRNILISSGGAKSNIIHSLEK